MPTSKNEYRTPRVGKKNQSGGGKSKLEMSDPSMRARMGKMKKSNPMKTQAKRGF